MVYTAPSVVFVGNSENIIKGQCGFGFENLAFSKTGARYTDIAKRTICYDGYVQISCCKRDPGCHTSNGDCQLVSKNEHVNM